ncbi:MAG: hypothetical protein RPU64_14150 [Candidatus Sedimenticola sp. (ex Thyasira tokunagai)]
MDNWEPVRPVKDWYSLEELWAAYGIDPGYVAQLSTEGGFPLWLSLNREPFLVVRQPPASIRYHWVGQGRDDDFLRLGGVIGVDGFLRLNSEEIYWSEVEDIDLVQAISSDIELVRLGEFDASGLPSPPAWVDMGWSSDEWKVLDPEKARNQSLLYLPIDGSLRLPIMDELYVASSDISDVVSMCWGVKRDTLDVCIPQSTEDLPSLPAKIQTCDVVEKKTKLQQRAEVLDKILCRLEVEHGLGM